MPSWLPDPPPQRRWRRADILGLLLVLVLAIVGYLIALPGSAIEIDLTRDLREGFAILDGEAWPRRGPEIGGLFHLGPWWFFLVAAVLALSSSLTAYVLIMGALASLKFLAAAWVGAQLGGPRLAMLTVAAASLPGLGVYQGLIVTHTSFVELFLWLTLGGVLSLRSPRWRAGKLFAMALAYAAAVHAHPSTLVALPFLLLGLAWVLGGLRAGLTALPWLLLGGAIALLPVGLELPTLLRQAFDPSARGPYARPVGDHWTSVWPLLRSLLWAEPEALAGSALASGGKAPLIWRALWIGLFAVGLFGALMYRPARQSFAALGCLFLMALGLAIMIRVPPFYAAYMLLVPLSLLLAMGWLSTVAKKRLGMVAILALAFGLQWSMAFKLPQTWKDGWAELRLPLADGLKARERQVQPSIFVSVAERDRMARFWCGLSPNERPAINGPWARLLDVSNGYELRLAGGKACREALRLGPGQAALLGLPAAVAAKLGIPTDAKDRALVTVAPSRIVAPAAPARLSEARTYPIRLREWEGTAQSSTLVQTFQVPASALVFVVPLQSMHLGWSVRAFSDGQELKPLIQTHDLQVFRAATGSDESRNWRIEVKRIKPELLNIVVGEPRS